MAKHLQRDRFTHPRPGEHKPRKMPPMEELPTSQEIVRNLKKARAGPDSFGKVVEISAVALDLSRTGNVALSYNVFGEAVRVAKSLPAHVREEALSHVQAAFRKTEMNMDCYFGLIRTYGPSQENMPVDA